MSTFPINKNIGLPLKAVDNGDGTSTLTTINTLFSAPADTDSGTVDYPDNVTEVYKFRNGGASGTVLRTITVIYTDATKNQLSSWSAV